MKVRKCGQPSGGHRLASSECEHRKTTTGLATGFVELGRAADIHLIKAHHSRKIHA